MERERLHGLTTRAGERGVDGGALHVLQLFDQCPGMRGHIADRKGHRPGAADDARDLDDSVLSFQPALVVGEALPAA